MPVMLSSLIVLFILVVALAVKSVSFRRKRVYTCPEQIQSLLNPPVPLSHLLQARAAPNQRLIHAFGLTSTFVSADPTIHKAFTANAKSLIAGHTWQSVALSAEAAAHRFLPPRQVDFATFVQCVTFAVVLSVLFGTDLDALRFEDVIYVTDMINQLWAASKVKDTTALQDGSLDKVMAHLHRWIPDRERYPNPLNLILPAYETMWRVVTVVVARVCCHRDDTLHNGLVAFEKIPTEEQFEDTTDGRPSVRSIVLEVLRLHPPTRHIARSASGSWWERLFGVVEIADVEGVHLSEAYGENFSEFDPTRFDPSTSAAKIAELYSFGFGKLRCIASSWAPMAAAVIAAKVVVQIEEGDCAITKGRQIGRRSGWDGWSIGKKQ